MIGTIVTPMERGQITLPKIYRDKLGITPETPLNVTLEDDRIVVRPLQKVISDMSGYVIKPKQTKEEALKFMKKLAKSRIVLWTKEDDEAREKMRKKEKYLNWQL